MTDSEPMLQPKGLHWDGRSLHFLDQTLLPQTERIVTTEDWREVVEAIRRLAIRGAPAIGIAAAFAAVLAWRTAGGKTFTWREALEVIEHARPTAVNLSYAVNRMRNVAESISLQGLDEALQTEAERLAGEDAGKCEAMAEYGVSLAPENSTALTHCNTGALVSYGTGTALGILRRAFQNGLLRHVYACEARPLGQGARLTMWELEKLAIPATLLCDSAAAQLMSEGRVDFVILGADRIAGNGDTANKIGTLALAILADRFKIPFYVAAPLTTFDAQARNGADFPLEYRSADEVRNCYGQQAAPAGCAVYNPAFDCTPGELITAFIREDGVHHPPYSFTSKYT